MRARKAFTLLEILIASALLSTLMIVLWSLFHTYTRLEERSSRTAVELQLIRSVSKQLRSDVEHFALLAEMPPVVPPETNSTQATESNSDEAPNEGSGSRSPDGNSNDDIPTEEDGTESDSEDVTSGDQSFIAPSVQIDVGEPSGLDSLALKTAPEFNASLLEQTFIRGSATKLELITRMPYTVDVPTGNALLGAETRYGTHQWVVYEWRDVRGLNSLLTSDPVLNPSKFAPPKPDPFRDPRLPVVPPPVATRLNPNDNVGLIRESKSWLSITRDQRRNAVREQADAAGLLTDGKFAWELRPNRPDITSFQEPSQTSQRSGELSGQALLPTWMPPPELRHKRDHIPEVTKLQFRYFDGESWQLEWTDTKSLPRAIEIAFDLDANAPAVRAKEFETAHTAMLAGATLAEVLPPPDELTDELDDPLALLNLEDPTAIVTEYRFVIGVPQGAMKEQEREGMEGSESTEELSFSLEESR